MPILNFNNGTHGSNLVRLESNAIKMQNLVCLQLFRLKKQTLLDR